MKIRTIIIAALACSLSMACGRKEGDTLVKITSGQISGAYEEGIYSYKGIQYAEAERFQPAKPIKWDGVRECLEFAPWAKQAGNKGSDEATGNFALNVWTAGLEDGAKRPVMMWIHGGGFSTGAGSAGPVDGAELAKKGVVLISINHRLDVLGFLDLSSFGGKWENSVNVGMLDIVEALRWAKANAKTFGGDPDNITIFGESGGGGKVGTLLNMPEAKGLFKKAIIMSGAKVNITDSKISQPLGESVVAELGLTSETLDQIQTIDFETLSAAARKCQAESLGARTPGSVKMWGFCPTADGKTLLEQPYTPGFTSLYPDVPVMIGSTYNELERTQYYSEPDFNEAQALEILDRRYGDRAGEYLELIKEAYPESEPADWVTIDSNIRLLSLDAADARSAAGGAPVYSFLLTWYGKNAEGRLSPSYHGLDIPLAFNNPGDERAINPKDERADKIADIMSDCWVNFAKTGVPSSPSLPEWEIYSKETGATMILDDTCGMKYNFDRKLETFLKDYLK